MFDYLKENFNFQDCKFFYFYFSSIILMRNRYQLSSFLFFQKLLRFSFKWQKVCFSFTYRVFLCLYLTVSLKMIFSNGFSLIRRPFRLSRIVVCGALFSLPLPLLPFLMLLMLLVLMMVKIRERARN